MERESTVKTRAHAEAEISALRRTVDAQDKRLVVELKTRQLLQESVDIQKRITAGTQERALMEQEARQKMEDAMHEQRRAGEETHLEVMQAINATVEKVASSNRALATARVQSEIIKQSMMGSRRAVERLETKIEQTRYEAGEAVALAKVDAFIVGAMLPKDADEAAVLDALLATSRSNTSEVDSLTDFLQAEGPKIIARAHEIIVFADDHLSQRYELITSLRHEVAAMKGTTFISSRDEDIPRSDHRKIVDDLTANHSVSRGARDAGDQAAGDVCPVAQNKAKETASFLQVQSQMVCAAGGSGDLKTMTPDFDLAAALADKTRENGRVHVLEEGLKERDTVIAKLQSEAIAAEANTDRVALETKNLVQDFKAARTDVERLTQEVEALHRTIADQDTLVASLRARSDVPPEDIDVDAPVVEYAVEQ